MNWKCGYLYDISSITSHAMKFEDYLKLEEKPNIRIENNIFFYMNDNFFINADFRKAEEETSYVYFKDEFIQVVDDWIYNGIIIETEEIQSQITSENQDELCFGKCKPEIKYVYVMLDKRNNYYKIGLSKNPYYRETTLQSEKPDIVLMSYYNGDRSDEDYLHKLFAKNRIRGEWFNLSDKDLLSINEYFNG